MFLEHTNKQEHEQTKNPERDSTGREGSQMQPDNITIFE